MVLLKSELKVRGEFSLVLNFLSVCQKQEWEGQDLLDTRRGRIHGGWESCITAPKQRGLEAEAGRSNPPSLWGMFNIVRKITLVEGVTFLKKSQGLPFKSMKCKSKKQISLHKGD
jgi:hypothetical protein